MHHTHPPLHRCPSVQRRPGSEALPGQALLCHNKHAARLERPGQLSVTKPTCPDTPPVPSTACRGKWDDGEECVVGVKLTGDPNVPAGAVSFRAKIGRRHRLDPREVYPDELGIVAR